MSITLDKEKLATYNIGFYGACYYGDYTGTKQGSKINYKGRPVGCLIRGQIGRRDIFRKRIGNGYAGSVARRVYQDRFRYFVPSTITHANGDASRSTFANGMSEWKNLSAGDKQNYRTRASKIGGMQGHNLFLKKYMEEHY